MFTETAYSEAEASLAFERSCHGLPEGSQGPPGQQFLVCRLPHPLLMHVLAVGVVVTSQISSAPFSGPPPAQLHCLIIVGCFTTLGGVGWWND
jgi:hypothetical protein